MMKRTCIPSLLLMVSISACSTWKKASTPKVTFFNNQTEISKQKDAVKSCMKSNKNFSSKKSRGIASSSCEAYNSIIYGGQTYNTGNIQVTNNNAEISFNLSSNVAAGWQIQAYHIYLGSSPIPTNSAGTPAPGQFPYKEEFSTPQTGVVVNVPLSDVSADCGAQLNVAVHTVMVKLDATGTVIQEETGWAYGPNQFESARWGWWFQYTVCCDVEENSGCTLTQGYWKTHSKYAKNASLKLNWPVSEDTLLCGKSWYSILQAKPKLGDAWTILAHQYIASKLNVANGASTGTIVNQSLDQSSSMLMGNCTTIPASLRQTALEYSLLLDNYNNGFTGPGHCQ